MAIDNDPQAINAAGIRRVETDAGVKRFKVPKGTIIEARDGITGPSAKKGIVRLPTDQVSKFEPSESHKAADLTDDELVQQLKYLQTRKANLSPGAPQGLINQLSGTYKENMDEHVKRSKTSFAEKSVRDLKTGDSVKASHSGLPTKVISVTEGWEYGKKGTIVKTDDGSTSIYPKKENHGILARVVKTENTVEAPSAKTPEVHDQPKAIKNPSDSQGNEMTTSDWADEGPGGKTRKVYLNGVEAAWIRNTGGKVTLERLGKTVEVPKTPEGKIRMARVLPHVINTQNTAAAIRALKKHGISRNEGIATCGANVSRPSEVGGRTSITHPDGTAKISAALKAEGVPHSTSDDRILLSNLELHSDSKLGKKTAVASNPAAPSVSISSNSSEFIKNKQLSYGKVNLSAKGNDPDRFKPKTSLGNGVKPKIGDAVRDASGRTGTILKTYQTHSAVKWSDDGSSKTIHNGKLNSSSKSSAPATPSTKPVTTTTDALKSNDAGIKVENADNVPKPKSSTPTSKPKAAPWVETVHTSYPTLPISAENQTHLDGVQKFIDIAEKSGFPHHKLDLLVADLRNGKKVSLKHRLREASILLGGTGGYSRKALASSIDSYGKSIAETYKTPGTKDGAHLIVTKRDAGGIPKEWIVRTKSATS